MSRTTQIVTDLEIMRAFLNTDPIATAYALGDLDPVYETFCTWFMSGEDGEAGEAGDGLRWDSLVLLYTGMSAPVLLTWGDAAGLGAIFDAFVDKMPDRAHIHMLPAHLPTVDVYFGVEDVRPMVRMGMAADAFVRTWLPQGDTTPAGDTIEVLGHRDTGDIVTLSAHYHGSFFEPSQLGTGHYYGIRRDGILVSMAGVHICSQADNLAALGNIVTHPDYRGQGLSTLLTSRLCDALIAQGCQWLALNVVRRNRSAVRVYEKLGFSEHNTYLEGVVFQTLDHRVKR